jgi:uncharacterized protein YchJ
MEDKDTTVENEVKETETEDTQDGFVNRIQTRREFKHIASIRNKPKKDEYKTVVFPKREKDESEIDYVNRCYEKTGCKPAPIGPMKKVGPNKPCPCGSERKFKQCCGR